MKKHAEMIALYWDYFVMSPSLMRGNTGGLANDTFLSKSYCVFETIAQQPKNSNVSLLVCLVKLGQHTLSNFAVHIKFWKKRVSKWAKKPWITADMLRSMRNKNKLLKKHLDEKRFLLIKVFKKNIKKL